MATLTIRNLDDKVHAALRVRAAQHGRSMEEEVRALIENSVAPPRFNKADAFAAAEELRALLRAANGGELPKGMVDELIAERRAEAAREEAEYQESVRQRSTRDAP